MKGRISTALRWIWVLAAMGLAVEAVAGIPPSIITQPASQTNYAGDTVTFAVTATGNAPLAYQWQKNTTNLTDGSEISGSATNTLTLTGISVSDYGNYSVVVTNASGRTNSASAALTVYARLVQNGGFETGDFSDWAFTGNTGGSLVDNDPNYVHSGVYGAEIGPAGSLAYLTQTLPTSIGQSYLISAWLWLDDTNRVVIPNEFLVIWDGNTLFDRTNMAATDWTNFQFVVTATGTNSVLTFGFRNDPVYLGFDDVSVQWCDPARTGQVVM